MPSLVSKAVTPEKKDWKWQWGASSTGPPDQKNLAVSGDFPAISWNLRVGLGMGVWGVGVLGFGY